MGRSFRQHARQVISWSHAHNIDLVIVGLVASLASELATVDGTFSSTLLYIWLNRLLFEFGPRLDWPVGLCAGAIVSVVVLPVLSRHRTWAWITLLLLTSLLGALWLWYTFAVSQFNLLTKEFSVKNYLGALLWGFPLAATWLISAAGVLVRTIGMRSALPYSR